MAGLELRAGCRVKSVRCARRGKRTAAGRSAGIACSLAPSCSGVRFAHSSIPSRGRRRGGRSHGRIFDPRALSGGGSGSRGQRVTFASASRPPLLPGRNGPSKPSASLGWPKAARLCMADAMAAAGRHSRRRRLGMHLFPACSLETRHGAAPASCLARSGSCCHAQASDPSPAWQYATTRNRCPPQGADLQKGDCACA